MRRVITALGLALASICVAVGFSAPANATPTPPGPGWTYQATFGWPDACASAGFAGQQAGQWVAYECDEVDAPSWDAPGLIWLFVGH
ncbi:MAG TPA: hypothetical protein VGL06_13280 [Pseudonocardiaceae bacterium]|jgi:hypothetical protein